MRGWTIGMTGGLLLLSGCATQTNPYVESQVSVFHQMPALPDTTATYSVLPWRSENAGSLEFDAYAEQVAAYLYSKGLKITHKGGPATYAVFLDYGIDDGRVENTSYSLPNFGVTGYGAATTTGTISRSGNTAYLNTTTTATPQYGVTGYSQVTASNKVYKRFVNIDIVEQASMQTAPKKIYQGRLKSEGSCGNLPKVMPSFIITLLGEFPGKNGDAKTVKTQWDGGC